MLGVANFTLGVQQQLSQQPCCRQTDRSLARCKVRRAAVVVRAKYDYSAREQYIAEVKRLIDQTELTSRTQQDGLTKLLLGVSLPLLKLIASTPPPKEVQDEPRSLPYENQRGASWHDSAATSQYQSSYREDGPRPSFGGSVTNLFKRERADVAYGQQDTTPSTQNPQVAVVIKLLRASFVGFAVSLFFGTVPFLDLLQVPDKGGALGWAVYSAGYLWVILALLRFGKLSAQQPLQVLPDATELNAQGSALSNTPSLLWFSLVNAAADGLLYRGALLTSVAVLGDIMVSMDANFQSMTSPTTIILITAAVETLVRVISASGAKAQDSYSYGATPGATDTAVNAGIHFALVAFLAAETLNTGSLVGSVGTQALGFYLATVAARQGWMQVPDGRTA